MGLWVSGDPSRKSFAVRVIKTVFCKKHGMKILLGHKWFRKKL